MLTTFIWKPKASCGKLFHLFLSIQVYCRCMSVDSPGLHCCSPTETNRGGGKCLQSEMHSYIIGFWCDNVCTFIFTFAESWVQDFQPALESLPIPLQHICKRDLRVTIRSGPCHNLEDIHSRLNTTLYTWGRKLKLQVDVEMQFVFWMHGWFSL